MALVTEARASRAAKTVVFKQTPTRREGSLRIAECTIPGITAHKLILQAGKSIGLRVNGFRPGKTPAPILYRHNTKRIDAMLIRELIANKPGKLSELLKKCATVPDYKVLPWNGTDELKIEVSFHIIPGVPVPGQQFGGAAGANEDPELAAPMPGSGVSVADLIPAQVSEQLKRHGVVTGAQMQLGGGSSTDQSAAPGLRLPANVGTDILAMTALSAGSDRAAPWESPSTKPTVDSPGTDPTTPAAQATGTAKPPAARRSSTDKIDAVRKSVAEIKEELTEASKT